jgi:hypothetical protein
MRTEIKKYGDANIDLDEFIGRMLPEYVRTLEIDGVDVKSGLRRSIEDSECHALFYGDTPVVIFGVSRAGAECPANVWAVQARGYENALVAFVRRGREITDEWAGRFGVIYGHVKAGNEKMLRWLSWCGFEIHPCDRGYAEAVKIWDSQR